MDKTLTINEIFHSIQGESYLAGEPCVFIRLTGCHQRCTYCDTEYAFYEGEKMTLGEILAAVGKYPCKNALITGGEPLLQGNCPDLARALLERGYRVAVETGGNRDIGALPEGVVRIMDWKTPASGECERNNEANLKLLKPEDEVKFVVTDEADADWALDTAAKRNLHALCRVSLSPSDARLLPVVAGKILASGLPIRLQTQFHKIIWPGRERGY